MTTLAPTQGASLPPVASNTITSGLTPTPTTSAPPLGSTSSPPATAIACGVERWAVKTGQDPEAILVDQAHPQPTTVQQLASLPQPMPEPTTRLAPTEFTVFEVAATLIEYKKESDRDYHVVIADAAGRTMIVELPEADCTAGPFSAAIAQVRMAFEARLHASSKLQHTALPVTVRGVGFFDKIHGQTGVAPNGIELHPVLAISFG